MHPWLVQLGIQRRTFLLRVTVGLLRVMVGIVALGGSSGCCTAEPLSLFLPPLKPLASHALSPTIGYDHLLYSEAGEREHLLRAVDFSLGFLQSKRAAELYRAVTIPGVDQGRVVRSLRRFRELVEQSQDATELRRRVWEEFEVFESVGRDGMGRVRFTGYFAPVYRGSLQRDERFRYPLYGAPAEGGVKLLRRELEGLDGLTPNPAVKGRELVYLDNRFDAFLIHIQGSARILLADGNAVTVGYAAGSDFPFVSVAQELIRDKRLTLKDTSLSGLREFFRKNPALLDEYLPRNNRFIFFKNLHDSPPRGSLGVPVTPERSIATDKAFMPPGALALINTEIPVQTPGTGVNRTGLKHQWVSRYVLDQDAGSAIRTPGRVDLYMGMGDEAGERAGRINSTGRLYYLLLREG